MGVRPVALAPEHSNATAPQRSRLRAALLPILLLLVGAVAYHSALDYPFIQDDYHHMWESRWRGWDSLPHILTVQLPFYRPVSNAWYFCIGDRVWGLNPLPYHIINILAYVASAWAVGLIGMRVFRSAAAGEIAAFVFLTTCGHLLAIYWICVMTAGWLVFWFCLAWIWDRFAWETGRRRWRVLASLAFALCVFSNVTGFTLVAILTVSAKLLPPRPSWERLARAHWSFYAWGALWILLQFGVLGWPPLQNYAIGADAGGVAGKGEILSNFVMFTLSPLYLAILRFPRSAWILFAGTLLALAGIGAWRFRVRARTAPQAAPGDRTGLLLAGFVVIWGLAPYLALAGHFAPYHVGIASIGVSLALGWLLGCGFPRRAGLALLAGWVILSVGAIRAYEAREHDTRGIGWKATLARNIVTDLGGLLATHPDMTRLVILNHNEHLWWFFADGAVPDLYYGRGDLEVVDGGDGRGIRPAPGQVVVRYHDRHLHLLD